MKQYETLVEAEAGAVGTGPTAAITLPFNPDPKELSDDRPRVGISACLLGTEVRFDGSHKRNHFVCQSLARHVTYVPVCPEVEIGMPVPRETLRLVRETSGVRMRGNRTGDDYTESMVPWARDRVQALREMNLDGFVLKKGSPSCGLARVAIYPTEDKKSPDRTGAGLFAQALQQAWPELPVTEEGWLHDQPLREVFLDSIFAHHRLRTALKNARKPVQVHDFHRAHKLLYMAHSPEHYRRLGQLAASVDKRDVSEVVADYIPLCMEALGVRTSRGKHTNVLMHVLGYFKEVLSAEDKQEMLELIEDYRSGLHGAVVPLTLLLHHLRKHKNSEWLAAQTYFTPYPKWLAL